MTEERPEALLKSALEKIIYFEARSEALHHDLEAARGESERLKAELAQAASRESELRRQLAEAEVKVGRAHREREELARLNEALRGERAAMIDKLVEATRIQGGDVVSDDGFDLAGFIALLRSESMRANAPQPAASAAPAAQSVPAAEARVVPSPQPAPPSEARASAVTEHAQRLRAEGRLEVNAQDVLALSRDRGELAGRTEETLFGFSIRELGAPDASARLRAAERLLALGATAAAPALASALHHEREPQVLVALLNAFAQLAGEQGVAVVLPHLDAAAASVRIAALKALLSLDATRAVPHLSAAMKDSDAAVRRRASLLALGLEPQVGLRLGEQAIHDADEDARALGALALGASTGERARSLLLEALKDPSEKVRQATARSLSRILGEDVSAVASLPDAQRRREIRRLATVPVKPSLAMARAPVRAAAPAAADVFSPAHVAAPSVSSGAYGAAPFASRPAAAPLATTAARAPVPPASVPLASADADADGEREPHWIELLAEQIADEPAPLWSLEDPARATEVELVTPMAKHSGAIATRILASSAPAPELRAAVGAPVYATVAASGAGRAASAGVRALASPPPSPVLAAPSAAPARASDGLPPKLLSSIVSELRRSPRGLTLPDLASSIDAPAPQVNAACAELLRRGDVARRGIKYFIA